jgi:hypothetical protein
MLRFGIFLAILFCTFDFSAQWRWNLQAEIGANKQEFQQVYALSQQPFDPKSFWKATAGGEVQLGYTFLKVMTLYSGLGYAHQNLAYQTTEWATDPDGLSYLLLCNKVATGELLTRTLTPAISLRLEISRFMGMFMNPPEYVNAIPLMLEFLVYPANKLSPISLSNTRAA